MRAPTVGATALLLGGLWMGAAAPADALICETLGAAGEIDQVAMTKIVAKGKPPFYGYYYYGCSPFGLVGNDTCSPVAKFTASELVDVIGTRAAGTAILLRDGGPGPCVGPSIVTAITGGGAVKLRGPEAQVFDDIDTSGTHPELTHCTEAIAAAPTASEAFAAMAPTQTFGKVVVEQGEELVIDGTGGAIVDMESLVLKAVPVRKYYGYQLGTCAYSYYELGGFATLSVTGNPGDEVVINTGSLDIGNCAEVNTDGPLVLFNVPGRGKKVRIGVSAIVDFFDGTTILAPERLVQIRGARSEADTRIGQVISKKLISIGYVYQSSGANCP